MVLPLNLAMTPSEIACCTALPDRIAWMSCHFCSCTEGIANIPEALPECAMLILTDRESCNGHSPDLAARQLLDTVSRLRCESVLLDFQRPWCAESAAMVRAIVRALPCPAAVTEAFADETDGPVFLAPCPLHMPLDAYLRPWKEREVWLEAALCQERITVTADGVSCTPVFPTQALDGGFHDRSSTAGTARPFPPTVSALHCLTLPKHWLKSWKSPAASVSAALLGFTRSWALS